MSLRFKGGERLQRGRGIRGLLQLVKSLYTPLVKSAGKSIVKAVTSNTGKAVMNSVKDQAIDSGMKLAADALRGENMEESMYQEMHHVCFSALRGCVNVRAERRAKVPFGQYLTILNGLMGSVVRLFNHG